MSEDKELWDLYNKSDGYHMKAHGSVKKKGKLNHFEKQMRGTISWFKKARKKVSTKQRRIWSSTGRWE